MAIIYVHMHVSWGGGGGGEVEFIRGWPGLICVCLYLALKASYIQFAQKRDEVLHAPASNQKCMKCSCRDNTFSPKALAEQIRCQWGACAGSTLSN